QPRFSPGNCKMACLREQKSAGITAELQSDLKFELKYIVATQLVIALGMIQIPPLRFGMPRLRRSQLSDRTTSNFDPIGFARAHAEQHTPHAPGMQARFFNRSFAARWSWHCGTSLQSGRSLYSN
ncbi:MAG: hypothetical protein ACK6D6_09445, partial [Planctomyces sp.]